MDLDGDEPPSLVQAKGSPSEEAPDPTTTQLQDLSITKVPLTIITGMYHRSIVSFLCMGVDRTTGYLGAGKTTLVNYILKEQHGKRIAVILNGLYTPLTYGPPSSTNVFSFRIR